MWPAPALLLHYSRRWWHQPEPHTGADKPSRLLKLLQRPSHTTLSDTIILLLRPWPLIYVLAQWIMFFPDILRNNTTVRLQHSQQTKAQGGAAASMLLQGLFRHCRCSFQEGDSVKNGGTRWKDCGESRRYHGFTVVHYVSMLKPEHCMSEVCVLHWYYLVDNSCSMEQYMTIQDPPGTS